ncbi:MAG: D-tyrosyl-tRNA(Tyr) deacylase [Gammaproteobacteria bacterium]|nr:D-tyrosyl-tRNA(Tyr) deacylase [Gammaproteobacteria bacterium]
MISLLQRVLDASVVTEGETIARIDKGVLVFLGIERLDADRQADRMLERVLGFRLFGDNRGRMNLSVTDVGGALLLVPQFTLAADTGRGMRPGFSSAAGPMEGKRLFKYFVTRARATHQRVEVGRFGADMQVHLVNDGPVTFRLRVAPGGA